MRCDWKYVGPSKMEGFLYYECSRAPCKMYAHSPYEASNIHNADNSPCQGTPRPHEWGHWLALILGAFFIDKRSWLWLKARLGLKPQCGCDKRQAMLNAIGRRIAASIARNYEWSQNAAIEWTCFVMNFGHKYQCSLDGCKCRNCGKAKPSPA